MKCECSLPDGYAEILSVDLQKNKKLSLFVNGLAIVIAVAMIVLMHLFVPIQFKYFIEDGYIVRNIVLIVLLVSYIILHELVHGIVMKIFGAKKVKYGFTGLYGFAGSDDFYYKKSYIVVALAPIVIWGLVLAVVNIIVPESWFWIIYIVQIVNISGAAGDLYVTFKFLKLPNDILIQDYGVGMKVYSKLK